MRPLFALSLALLLGQASSAYADLVFENELNDTMDTANKTLGVDNLGFAGSLTLGDIDTFSLFITPNAQQEAYFAFDVFWSAGTDSFPQDPSQNRWLVARLPVDDIFGQVAIESNYASIFFGVYPSPAQVYCLQLFSTFEVPDPFTFAPISGSTVAGDYRLTNIRGYNGATVRGTAMLGTAVPEPSSVLLGLALIGSGLWIKRRGKKRNR